MIEPIKGKVPRPKHRLGVIPTKFEEPIHKVLPRKKKHKKPVDLSD